MACVSINGLPKFFFLLTFVFSINFLMVSSVEFDVGGPGNGWVVPTPRTDQLYNEWASKNRFKVDDTLRFEYKKDSVLVVTKEEYEKCRSTHPLFFSNNGNTIFKLDRPGLFYFISGVAGHCERGLKMIVKVLELESPPQIANQTTNGPPTSGALEPRASSMFSHIMIFIITLLVALLLI